MYTDAQDFAMGAADVELYAVWEYLSYNIGDIGPAGGYIFYDNSTYDVDGWRYLEAAPNDIASYPWGTEGTLVGGLSELIGDGLGNTSTIVSKLGTGFSYAAFVCQDYNFNTYNDWFLPSHNELLELYAKKASIPGLTLNYYWSSTESVSQPEMNAEAVSFTDGAVQPYSKGTPQTVRAIRRF